MEYTSMIDKPTLLGYIDSMVKHFDCLGSKQWRKDFSL